MEDTRQSAHRATALFLECVPVFSELPEEHLEYLSGLCGRVHLPPGELLFEEGDPGDAVFVIRRGAVEVFTRLPNGDELVLARLGHHELIGEHYLFDGTSGKRGASVRASQAAELIRISHDTFDRLLKRNPTIAKQLAWRRMQRESDNLERRSELYRIIRNVPAQTPTQRVHISQGEAVFREGDAADGVYLITAGYAKVYREEEPEKVLGELVPGQCFGERAVVSDTPRSATIVAKTALDLLLITKENFIRLHEQSSDLRDVVCGLEFSYQLPSRGLALQYTCRREDEDSIERLYRLPDQREFLSTFLVKRRVFRLERIGVNQTRPLVEHSWRNEEGSAERTLRVGPLGDIQGIVVSGTWGLLPQLIEAALDATPLADSAFAAFVRTGEFSAEGLEDKEPQGGQADLACFCLQLPVNRINELIKTGYSSFEALRKTTGCGSLCGGCESRICDLLNPPDLIPVSATATTLSESLRSFKLTGATRYPDWQPGQHLLIEGRIRGAWVRRPYLITAPAGAGVPPEIVVMREPQGEFTRWLFDGPPGEKQLRISRPRGKLVWQGDQTRPTVCMTHDIGGALALAIVRTAIAQAMKARIHIECFCGDPAYASFVSELRNAAISNPSISFNARAWPIKNPERGDLSRALKSQFPDAEYFICAQAEALGPLRDLAKRAEASDERIHEEIFFHTGGPAMTTHTTSRRLRRFGLVGIVVTALIVAGLLLYSHSVGGFKL